MVACAGQSLLKPFVRMPAQHIATSSHRCAPLCRCPGNPSGQDSQGALKPCRDKFLLICVFRVHPKKMNIHFHPHKHTAMNSCCVGYVQKSHQGHCGCSHPDQQSPAWDSTAPRALYSGLGQQHPHVPWGSQVLEATLQLFCSPQATGVGKQA